MKKERVNNKTPTDVKLRFSECMRSLQHNDD